MPLPFDVGTIHITPELLSLIAEIDEFKGAWRAIGRMAPDQLSRLRHVATIESIGSSTRIEGARLSDREIERLLSNPQLRSFANRDEQEVAGYAEAMETVFAHWEAITLTETTSSSFIAICWPTPRRMQGIAASTRRCPTRWRP